MSTKTDEELYQHYMAAALGSGVKYSSLPVQLGICHEIAIGGIRMHRGAFGACEIDQPMRLVHAQDFGKVIADN